MGTVRAELIRTRMQGVKVSYRVVAVPEAPLLAVSSCPHVWNMMPKGSFYRLDSSFAVDR